MPGSGVLPSGSLVRGGNINTAKTIGSFFPVRGADRTSKRRVEWHVVKKFALRIPRLANRKILGKRTYRRLHGVLLSASNGDVTMRIRVEHEWPGMRVNRQETRLLMSTRKSWSQL